MITSRFVAEMARYNRWQNASLFGAAAMLSDASRRLDRGAFFGSIHRTFNHLLWGDTIWMSRFDGWDAPEVGIAESADWVADWDALCAQRAAADARILDWAGRVPEAALQGDLAWHSGALKRNVVKPVALCIAHFFNHQTHHRGQIHAMLTAAGASPGATDLFAMPDDA